jgi:hypothetical protein
LVKLDSPHPFGNPGAFLKIGGILKMAERDTLDVQRKRIEELAREIYPNCIVKFEPLFDGLIVRFGVFDPLTKAWVAGPSRQHLVSVIADMADANLRRVIRSLSPGPPVGEV